MEWFQVRFTFVFNSLNILHKVQTLTNSLWLEGRWEQKGELGKKLNILIHIFFSVFSSSKVFLLSPSSPVVARSWSDCCVCVKEGI